MVGAKEFATLPIPSSVHVELVLESYSTYRLSHRCLAMRRGMVAGGKKPMNSSLACCQILAAYEYLLESWYTMYDVGIMCMHCHIPSLLTWCF